MLQVQTIQQYCKYVLVLYIQQRNHRTSPVRSLPLTRVWAMQPKSSGASGAAPFRGINVACIIIIIIMCTMEDKRKKRTGELRQWNTYTKLRTLQTKTIDDNQKLMCLTREESRGELRQIMVYTYIQHATYAPNNGWPSKLTCLTRALPRVPRPPTKLHTFQHTHEANLVCV